MARASRTDEPYRSRLEPVFSDEDATLNGWITTACVPVAIIKLW